MVLRDLRREHATPRDPQPRGPLVSSCFLVEERPPAVMGGLHIAFTVEQRETVDAFHAAGLEAGARRARAGSITRTITAPTFSSPTGTTSRPSATSQPSSVTNTRSGALPHPAPSGRRVSHPETLAADELRKQGSHLGWPLLSSKTGGPIVRYPIMQPAAGEQIGEQIESNWAALRPKKPQQTRALTAEPDPIPRAGPRAVAGSNPVSPTD